MFLKVREDAKADDVVDTVELADGVDADIDAQENIVGITIHEPAWSRIQWVLPVEPLADVIARELARRGWFPRKGEGIFDAEGKKYSLASAVTAQVLRERQS